MNLLKQTLLYLALFTFAGTVPGANGQFSQIRDWFSSLFGGGDANANANENENETTNKIANKVSSTIWSLEGTLGDLMSDLGNFSRPLSEVAWCYEATLNGRQMDIFNESVNFKSIAIDYYKTFKKNITHEGISNLFNSTREMITRCMGRTRSSSVQYGFTQLSDQSLEDVQQMLGVTEPSNQFNNRGKRLSGSDRQCVSDRSSTPPEAFDWRDQGMVTEVKNQGNCGSDWAFATTAAIESGLLVRHRTLQKNVTLNLSEQQLVDCVKENGCTSGNSRDSFSYVKNHGLSEEKMVPYVGRVEACPYSKVDYYYPISDFCIRSRFRYGYQALTESLSDSEIQRILHQVGPLYVLVDGNPSLFRNYRAGVFDERSCSTQVNHAVLLVGYTNNAWILKNSFSKKWGEAGYFRLARNKNMCGINSEIAWPLI